MTHTPDLSAECTAALAAHAVDCRDELQPAYGEPLAGVVAATTPWRDWLEAAVLAGYVPHLEGIELALRGAHALHLAQLEADVANGVLGDALNQSAMADGYRELSALLESFTADLERHAAEINRRPPDGPMDGTVLAMWEQDAAEAEVRAARAEARGEQAVEDNERARQLRDRYRNRHDASAPVATPSTSISLTSSARSGAPHLNERAENR